MSNDKFEFTGETREHLGLTLHRIRSLRDFGHVITGELGGWLREEQQLQFEGNAWVGGDAVVTGNARVSENAVVGGNARVSENARVADTAVVVGDAIVTMSAWVVGNAVVSGNAVVGGDAVVSGNATVTSNAIVAQRAKVAGNAVVAGDSLVSGNAMVTGTAVVKGDAVVSVDSDLVCIGPIGSEKGTMIAHRDKKLGVRVTRGCHSGSLEGFKKAVDERHGDNFHGQTYRSAITFIESFFAIAENWSKPMSKELFEQWKEDERLHGKNDFTDSDWHMARVGFHGAYKMLIGRSVSVPQQWREIMEELATDLENEIEDRRSSGLDRRIERDLVIVREARALLAEQEQDHEG